MPAGAIQARINSAIESRLRADTIASPEIAGDSLEELFLAIGGTVSPDLSLWWYRAPEKAPAPYLVYGPEERVTTTDPTRCGEPGNSEVRYVVMLVTVGKNSLLPIPTIDRVASLLDGYAVTVSSQRLQFLREGDFCEPDITSGERGLTRTGLIYRVVAA